MRITKEDSLVLLIDVQERLFPHIASAERLETQLINFLKGSNKLGIPLILSEQYKKGLGETLPSLVEIISPAYTIEKKSFSCIDHMGFVADLSLMNKQNVVIVGIESHICVLQTAIDLKTLGYNPIVVVDAIGSRSVENKMIAIERMKQEGVILTSVESILFEWCREAGSEEFKYISKLIK